MIHWTLCFWACVEMSVHRRGSETKLHGQCLVRITVVAMRHYDQ